MSPTFRKEKGYHFYTFSNEEDRMHVHVSKDKKGAKIWLEPKIEIAKNSGFSEKELNSIIKIITTNETEFKEKYRKHIGKSAVYNA